MNTNSNEPLIPASTSLPEFTIKAIILSIALALILSAANVYLALKIGTTISASIPASILAIGVLRFFRNHNVLECNLIQTAASGGEGVAAAIAFVLPAMLFVHAWQSFSYWETFWMTVIGGLLGVIFTVPLRRVLLNLPTLKFPEGTAIGNVLKSATQSGKQLGVLVQGCGVGALITFAQTGLKVIANDWQLWTLSKGAIFGLAFGYSPAAIAAGFIVGFDVAVSLFVGILINWIIFLPIISAHSTLIHDTPYNIAMDLWSSDLRFIGVGTMLVGGIWTIIRLMKPVFEGIKISWKVMISARKTSGVDIPRTEKDVSLLWVFIIVLIMLLISLVFIYHAFVKYSLGGTQLYFLLMSSSSAIYILIVGFILSAVAGYFTGLVGSTNNPLSGILLMSIILLGLIYFCVFHASSFGGGVAALNKLPAIIIIITTMIATSAAISNDNIQDLKAGQMVGATPWKQQVMLGLGVIVSAMIMAPVLNLLYQAYGIAGSFPHAGMDPSHMLPAPQASLIATVATGVLTLHLKWKMILTGVITGIFLIIVDEILKKRNYRLPVLAVGLGMYLPMEIIMPFVIGGIATFFAKRKQQKMPNEKREESFQRGTLLASGLVAGSAIVGVVLAIPFVIAGSSNVLVIMPDMLTPLATALGFASLIGLCYWLYKQ